MIDDEAARTLNLLGAFTVAVADRVHGATASATDGRQQFPAAIIQIGNTPGCTIRSLCLGLGVTHSATVRIVAELVELGLVNKQKLEGHDKRAVSLTLSESGESLYVKILAQRRDILAPLLARISPAERLVLSSILERCLPLLATTECESELVCRLCDVAACPAETCPATPPAQR